MNTLTNTSVIKTTERTETVFGNALLPYKRGSLILTGMTGTLVWRCACLTAEGYCCPKLGVLLIETGINVVVCAESRCGHTLSDYITTGSSCQRSCRPPADLCSTTVVFFRDTNEWKGGNEPRRVEILQTVRDRGKKFVHVNMDHHQPQSLRCDQVPGTGEGPSPPSRHFIVKASVWKSSTTGNEASWVVARFQQWCFGSRK